MREAIRGAAYRLARWLGLTSSAAANVNGMPALVATTVAETTPCNARLSDWRGRRLNLLLPSINARHYFGGIHTAVQLYRALAEHFPATRIILVDSAPDDAALQRFSDHTKVSCDADSAATRQIVPFNDRYGRTLPVGADDCWLTTAWWTTYSAQRLAAWQQQQFGAAGPLINLIQDFEPGFYSWSSHSALALGTYRPDQDVGVFNTSLLADYFELQGLAYKHRFVFEPTLNDELRHALVQARTTSRPRQRRMVIYARPSTPRNAFELLCEALRTWGWSDPTFAQWEVVAAGELTADLDLGPFKMHALGKLDLPAYAQLLATSAIGVSLMISPHPSYPPLEMAAFGMGVVTNRFANKHLDNFSPNIRSVGQFTPEAIAAAIAREVGEWERRQMLPLNLMRDDHAFLGEGGFDEVARQIALSGQMRGS
jgi:O-antigen biosynthesis protein